MRDYLPIEEVAKQLVALVLKKQGAGIINVCSGKPISVRGLIEKWLKNEEASFIELNRGYYDYPDYEPMAFWGDNSKFKKLITDSSI